MRLNIGLIGPGLVGAELMQQVAARFGGSSSSSTNNCSPSSSPPPQPPLAVSLVGVATSRRMALLPTSAPPSASLDLKTEWKSFLNGNEEQESEGEGEVKATPTDLSALVARLASSLSSSSSPTAAAVLVDCSASESPPSEAYELALSRGVSVVTPNKSFAAGDAKRYERALAAAAATAAAAASSSPSSSSPAPLYLGEATVGAGLPVLSTLRDLLATGDRVRRVEGVFSGTLSFIFNALCADGDGGRNDAGGSGRVAPPPSLASVVRKAKELGFTEPDPRDDLGGVDVARKAVILARAIASGTSRRTAAAAATSEPRRRLLELSDVPVRSLVPASLSDRSLVGVEEFLSGLERDDGGVGEEAARARAEGKVLRFVGCVTVGVGDGDEGDCGDHDAIVRADVALRAFPKSHPFSGLSGADNVFAFVTERYPETSPLVVRGPGAGAAVTAAGVFGDILTVARAAGANV